MRISVVGYSRRIIGGTEQNLDVILPAFEGRGHRLQYVFFHDAPADRLSIRTGMWTDLVDVSVAGESQALAKVRAFRPDLINVHGEVSPDFQRHLLDIAPAAYSVHNYYGTCISGLKTNQFPVIQPCERKFGPACLLHYFPRRCGGLNPLTMVQRYQQERDRLAVMSEYEAVIVHTAGMEAEYLRHGFHPARIHGLPYEVAAAENQQPQEKRPDLMAKLNLLFIGRIEKLKGGHVLIAALSRVRARLQRPIELHFAGDGPDMHRWMTLAAQVMEKWPDITVHFHGWLSRPDIEALFRRSHLLVVPSLWPEPFGKVGPEAGNWGVPVAAFDVGGISEWLNPGVNGHIAPGNPPTTGGLADAIVSCVSDREIHAHLSNGAAASVRKFDLQNHVDHLLQLFEQICRKREARFPQEALV